MTERKQQEAKNMKKYKECLNTLSSIGLKQGCKELRTEKSVENRL